MSAQPPQPSSDALAGRLKNWNPAFPDFAVSPDQGIYAQPETGGAIYEQAPSSSHVYGWKLQSGGFVKKFYGQSVRAPDGTIAVLTVAFKGSKTQGIATEYEYYFTDEAVAETYLNAFRIAAHPGYVVQDMIAAKVPYKKKSG